MPLAGLHSLSCSRSTAPFRAQIVMAHHSPNQTTRGTTGAPPEAERFTVNLLKTDGFPKASGLWRVQGGALALLAWTDRQQQPVPKVSNVCHLISDVGHEYCRRSGLVQSTLHVMIARHKRAVRAGSELESPHSGPSNAEMALGSPPWCTFSHVWAFRPASAVCTWAPDGRDRFRPIPVIRAKPAPMDPLKGWLDLERNSFEPVS